VEGVGRQPELPQAGLDQRHRDASRPTMAIVAVEIEVSSCALARCNIFRHWRRIWKVKVVEAEATLDRGKSGGASAMPGWTLPRCASRRSSNDFGRKSLVIRPRHENVVSISSLAQPPSAYQYLLRLSVANAPVPASRHSTQMAKWQIDKRPGSQVLISKHQSYHLSPLTTLNRTQRPIQSTDNRPCI